LLKRSVHLTCSLNPTLCSRSRISCPLNLQSQPTTWAENTTFRPIVHRFDIEISEIEGWFSVGRSLHSGALGSLLVCLRHRTVWSLQVMRTYSWKFLRRVWLTESIWLVLWGQWPYWRILPDWECCVMRCLFLLECRRFSLKARSWMLLWSWELERCICLSWSYLTSIHSECRTEHSVLHGLKLWDGVIFMWRTDLEMELCVPTMFCIQKNIVQKTVNESLRSWRATRLV
jgi:hypothetical protein